MEYYIKGEGGNLRDFIFSANPGKGQDLLKAELGEENLEFNEQDLEIIYKGVVFEVDENGETRKAVNETASLTFGAGYYAGNVKIGEQAPDFSAVTTQGNIKLSDYKGKWLVFFSHPRRFYSGLYNGVYCFCKSKSIF